MPKMCMRSWTRSLQARFRSSRSHAVDSETTAATRATSVPSAGPARPKELEALPEALLVALLDALELEALELAPPPDTEAPATEARWSFFAGPSSARCGPRPPSDVRSTHSTSSTSSSSWASWASWATLGALGRRGGGG